MKGQIEDDSKQSQVKNVNDKVGFKCLHYSVMESSGQVDLTIVKKQKDSSRPEFGVRTVVDTAK